jgi:hypothetical protein
MLKNTEATKQDQTQTKPNIKNFDTVKSFMDNFVQWQRDLAIKAYIEGIFDKETLIGKFQELKIDNFKILQHMKIIDKAKEEYWRNK